ncbi:MAG: ATP-binding cassette domain-containing protein [Bacillota bacterium]|nr:MAG: ATP-binding cassette domain-containing protein [Bacillota bacterium]
MNSKDCPALVLRNVCYRYPDGTRALSGVDMRVEQGERRAILGPNGAGKSTLALMLNGLFRPSSGEVEVWGRVIGPDNERWARRMVGLVFQDPDDQVFSPTVAEDLRFGPRNLGCSEEEATRRAREALRRVDLDWDTLACRPPQNLSYGQRKRVAIAGVLAMAPRVIALDEPTANLDPLAEDALLDVLDDLHGDGVTLAVVTHDVELAASWADKVTFLREGVVVADGDVRLLWDPETVARAGLRSPRWSRRREAGWPPCFPPD